MTRKWRSRSPLPLVSLVLGLTMSLLLLLPQTGWTFSRFDPVAASTIPAVEPQAAVHQLGDVEYADVTLDGEQLFSVTANVVPGKPVAGLSPVQQRTQAIEATLHRLLKQDFDPQDLYVTVASLDRQTVILAGEQTRNIQDIVLTVTASDAQLAGKPIAALAQDWADRIHQALLQGQAARRPEARQQQIIHSALVGAAIGGVSLLLYGIHRWIYTLFEQRRQRLLQSIKDQISLDLEANPTELPQDFKHLQALRQRQLLNVLLRRLLRLTQLVVWSGGIAWILWIFPDTRGWGQLLIAFILKLFVIVLAVLVAAQICRLAINQRLRILVEEASLKPGGMQRMVLRAPTLTNVLDEIVKFVALCLAIVLLIDWEQLPIGSIWTGAGLLSVAFSLVFQNLLRDWLNGFLIIFGDHYAVGDTVSIAGQTGLVESMSLRSTQIRGEGGSLSTIPHGQITTIQNLTKDWSRVDFSVTIAQSADIAHAMQVMKQVAEEMAHDPEWRADILEPASLLGVERISASGTQLLMWIKTKRSKQRAIEQAFRYRLKLAFDQSGIQIG